MISAILKGSLLFFSRITLQLVSFLVGLYSAKILTVESFGVFSLIRTLFMYASFISLGITESILFKLPMSIAKDDRSEIDKNQKILFTTAFITLPFLGVGIILAFFEFPLNGINLKIEWIFVCFIIFLSSIAMYSNILYTCYQEFFQLALFKLTYPAIYGLTAFLFLKKFGLNAVLVGMILGYALMIAFSLPFIRGKIGFFWEWKPILEHIKFGLPIKLSSLVWIVLITVDLWIASAFLGGESGGKYGFAILIGAGFSILPMILSGMAHPRLSSYYSQVDGNPEKIFKVFKDLFFCFLGLSLLVSILVLVFFYYVVQFYYPQYQSIQILFPVLIFGYLVESSIFATMTLLVVLKKQIPILLINIGILALVFFTDLIAAIYFQSLFFIAASTALGLCLHGILTLVLFHKTMPLSKKFLIQYISGIILGFVALNTTYSGFTLQYVWIKIALFACLLFLVGGLFVMAFLQFISFWQQTSEKE